MTSNFGIIYVATGKKYVNEAFASALITSSNSENVPIVISTDLVEYSQSLNSQRLFHSILRHPQPVYSYRDKITGLLNLPFKRCLFLDTDAFLVSTYPDLPVILDHFHVGGCHSPVRHPPGWSDSQIPLSFPEINTGVLLLRRSPKVHYLINEWIKLYDFLKSNYNQSWDQASFRSVLWKSIIQKNICFHALPSEYNLRTTKPWTAGRGQPVRIVHGRFDITELSPFLSYLNDDIDKFRTWSIWSSMFPKSTIRPRHDRTFS